MIKRWIVGGIVGCLVIYVSLQFPKLYIKKSFTYKSFEIYSNSKIENNVYVKNILDSVLLNLTKSEFYNPEQSFKLFFVKGTLYSKIISNLGMKNIASSKFDTHIYNANPDFKSGWLIKNKSEYEKLNLVQIISHECVHSQMYPDYSTLGIMKTPAWINEGYCEYISYSLKRKRDFLSLVDILNKLEASENHWLKTSYLNYSPRFYLKSRLIVEYLIEIKHMTILEIISNEDLDPDIIYEDIKLWYNNQEQI